MEQQQQFLRSESRLSEPIDSFDERREDEYYQAADEADQTIRRLVSADAHKRRESSGFANEQKQKRQSVVSAGQSHRESLLIKPVQPISL